MSTKYGPLGIEIKKHLNRLEWSQNRLAEESGITQSAISKFMREKTRPTPDSVSAIANVLGVDAMRLMHLAGIPLPPKTESLDPLALHIAQQLTEMPKGPRMRAIGAVQEVVDAISDVHQGDVLEDEEPEKESQEAQKRPIELPDHSKMWPEVTINTPVTRNVTIKELIGELAELPPQEQETLGGLLRAILKEPEKKQSRLKKLMERIEILVKKNKDQKSLDKIFNLLESQVGLLEQLE